MTSTHEFYFLSFIMQRHYCAITNIFIHLQNDRAFKVISVNKMSQEPMKLILKTCLIRIIELLKREKVSTDQSFICFYPWNISCCFEIRDSISSYFILQRFLLQSCDEAFTFMSQSVEIY